MATHGTEQWAGVVAKAMTAGGMSHADSLQALSSFKTAVAAKMAKTVRRPCCPKPSLHAILSLHSIAPHEILPECQDGCAAAKPAERVMHSMSRASCTHAAVWSLAAACPYVPALPWTGQSVMSHSAEGRVSVRTGRHPGEAAEGRRQRLCGAGDTWQPGWLL